MKEKVEVDSPIPLSYGRFLNAYQKEKKGNLPDNFNGWLLRSDDKHMSC
jgi:hypothetical protein